MARMALRKSIPRRGARGDDHREVLLDRLLVECRHFRNFDFRVAVGRRLVDSGTLDAIAARQYTAPGGQQQHFGGGGGTLATMVHRSLRPSGVACGGRRVPSVEVRDEGVLDVAAALQDASDELPHCMRVAVVFATHPPESPPEGQGRGICHEEEDLLGRTTWAEAFLRIGDQDADGQHDAEVTEHCARYIGAGTTECLVGESVWVIRHCDGDGCPSDFRREPRMLGAVVAFLPQPAPPLDRTDGGDRAPRPFERAAAYAEKTDRVRYRAQVDAALQHCAALDCDGVVVGCVEGICGSEVFRHPMAEVAEVWRDSLAAHGEHFRRVAFALGKETPLNRRVTAGFLSEIVGAVEQR